MGKDIIVDIIIFIWNVDMNRKGIVWIGLINIIESIVKIFLWEGFIENVRKYCENN